MSTWGRGGRGQEGGIPVAFRVLDSRFADQLEPSKLRILMHIGPTQHDRPVNWEYKSSSGVKQTSLCTLYYCLVNPIYAYVRVSGARLIKSQTLNYWVNSRISFNANSCLREVKVPEPPKCFFFLANIGFLFPLIIAAKTPSLQQFSLTLHKFLKFLKLPLSMFQTVEQQRMGPGGFLPHFKNNITLLLRRINANMCDSVCRQCVSKLLENANMMYCRRLQQYRTRRIEFSSFIQCLFVMKLDQKREKDQRSGLVFAKLKPGSHG